MPRAKRAEPASEDTIVDEPVEPDTLTGDIGEAEDPFLVELAKSLGYKEAGEWTKDHGQERERDQAKRLTVREFLADTPKHLAALKESSERSARAAAEAIEDERRRAREEATRTLVESEDREEREKAAAKLASNQQVPPQTQAWIAKNPWFETDPVAQRVAVDTINRAHAMRLPVDQQLLAGEEAVRREFPQYFAPSVSEQRLSDVRRAAPMPPQVQQGTRAAATQPREKGFAQIPRADREAFVNNLQRKFMARGLTQEQAQQRYAESYWRAPPEDPATREPERWPTSPVSSNVWAARRR